MWQRLLDQYKGRLPVNVRVMLNMVSGVVDGRTTTKLEVGALMTRVEGGKADE